MDLPFLRRGLRAAILVSAVGGLVSCGKKSPEKKVESAVVAEALSKNRVAERSGAVFRTQEASPIHWQPWSAETLKNALAAKRLVLAVVVMPQQSDFREVLRKIEQDPALVNGINSSYVPVLVDGDAMREMGLVAAPLCGEIRLPLDLPLFLWMTGEGNPVAWMPISGRRVKDVTQIFNQSHQMVSRMWQDDPEYVMRNSSLDNETRKTRLKGGRDTESSKDPANAAAAASRQLLSLYDPFSRSIDDSGGLFPSGVLDVVSASGALPGLPDSLRERAAETSGDLLEDLLPSAMFDPLEGGVFSGRLAASWSLPSFTWNCPDQGRVAALLFRSHQLTGNPMALDRAVRLLKFAENRFLTEADLFAFGTIRLSAPTNWLWKTEDIEKELPAEDAKWWIEATGMARLGNLPSEIDPERAYFRGNSLSLPLSLGAVAVKLGVPEEAFAKRFEASREKLLAIRRAKRETMVSDTLPHAGANFRMISAYAAGYAATGNEEYRVKAKSLLERSKKKFFTDGRLLAFAPPQGGESVDARAFLYALAVQSTLDVMDITSDESQLSWISELTDAAAARFKDGDFLYEASTDERLMDLPISDRRRIFDDTTGGLFALSEARISPTGHPAAAVLRELASDLSQEAPQSPILHTDAILAALVKHHANTLMLGPGLSAEMKAAVARLPLQLVRRGLGKVSDGIPEGSVRVILPDGTVKLISVPSDLWKEVIADDPSE